MPTAKTKISFPPAGALRLGLCCQFLEQPIKFRVNTATAMQRLPRREQLARFAELCAGNAEALLAALQFCATHGIGSFRILTSLLSPCAGMSM